MHTKTTHHIEVGKHYYFVCAINSSNIHIVYDKVDLYRPLYTPNRYAAIYCPVHNREFRADTMPECFHTSYEDALAHLEQESFPAVNSITAAVRRAGDNIQNA